MYATALIVFREILEAGLIIGIVLAATQGVPHRNRWVLTGVGAGLLGAFVTAALADQLVMAMQGAGQEVFNAAVLYTAVIMLGWHSIWMQKHGRELAGKLRRTGSAVLDGTQEVSVLAVIVGLAVLREGAEVVLFLNGIAASAAGNTPAMLTGGFLGIAGGVLVGLLLYRGLLRIPSRYLFRVTTWLILLLAAGMAAQGARYLEQANILPSLGGAVWNTSRILPDNSIVGQVLHTLIGYTARPDMVQLLAYLATLIIIGVLMKYLNRQNNHIPAQRASA
jgi:high-affinity iron transporter